MATLMEPGLDESVVRAIDFAIVRRYEAASPHGTHFSPASGSALV